MGKRLGFLAFFFALFFTGWRVSFAAVAPAQELAQLRDIHLPAPVSWWPLAAGWYLLMLVLMSLLLALIFFLHRHYVQTRAKRHALRLLAMYQQQYLRDANSQLCCARVSELLKRVALVYFPRERVASLQGCAWLAFLNDTAKGVDFNQARKELLELPYQPGSRNNNLGLLFNFAKTWISQRRGLCLS